MIMEISVNKESLTRILDILDDWASSYQSGGDPSFKHLSLGSLETLRVLKLIDEKTHSSYVDKLSSSKRKEPMLKHF